MPRSRNTNSVMANPTPAIPVESETDPITWVAPVAPVAPAAPVAPTVHVTPTVPVSQAEKPEKFSGIDFKR